MLCLTWWSLHLPKHCSKMPWIVDTISQVKKREQNNNEKSLFNTHTSYSNYCTDRLLEDSKMKSPHPIPIMIKESTTSTTNSSFSSLMWWKKDLIQKKLAIDLYWKVPSIQNWDNYLYLGKLQGSPCGGAVLVYLTLTTPQTEPFCHDYLKAHVGEKKCHRLKK